mmetsp:Transcript_58065/g.147315  ORF Transcript_58065/g.147315 Transcript_58065/m.147315 type:complete len:210 (-) Transcript_58065:980-1609(-)
MSSRMSTSESRDVDAPESRYLRCRMSPSGPPARESPQVNSLAASCAPAKPSSSKAPEPAPEPPPPLLPPAEVMGRKLGGSDSEVQTWRRSCMCRPPNQPTAGLAVCACGMLPFGLDLFTRSLISSSSSGSTPKRLEEGVSPGGGSSAQRARPSARRGCCGCSGAMPAMPPLPPARRLGEARPWKLSNEALCSSSSSSSSSSEAPAGNSS